MPSTSAAPVALPARSVQQRVTRATSYKVAADVAAARLVLFLQAYEPPPIPFHFVMQADRSLSAKLRAFVDFAAPLLRSELSRPATLIGPDLFDRPPTHDKPCQ